MNTLKPEKIPKGRMLGKSYDAAHQLYQEIQNCKKYIQYVSPNGLVHILPDKKLEEIKKEEHTHTKEVLIERLRGMKPIIWNDDPQKHLDNIVKYNTIDQAIALVEEVFKSDNK